MKKEYSLVKMLFYLTGVLLTVFSVDIAAQSVISCKVDGDNFTGKIEDAVQVTIGEEHFIQIKSTYDDKILYLNIKTTKLKGEMPITLKYKDLESGQTGMPDAEVVWVPDGPDKPQWNTVEGKAVITKFDMDNKIISGKFEFTVEKFQYSSKAKDSRPSEDVEEGTFNEISYRVEEKKAGG